MAYDTILVYPDGSRHTVARIVCDRERALLDLSFRPWPAA